VFKFKLDPEVQRRLDYADAYEEWFAKLSPREQAIHLRYVWLNSAEPQWPRGSIVYDASLHHILIPVLIRQLCPEVADMNHTQLQAELPEGQPR